MRQKNREVSNREELLEIMRRCDVCRLALNNEGYPYIVPMNFGLSVDEDKSWTLFARITAHLLRWMESISFSILRSRVTVPWLMKVSLAVAQFVFWVIKRRNRHCEHLWINIILGKMLILIRQQSPERRFMFLKLRVLPEKGSCQSDTAALQYEILVYSLDGSCRYGNK